MFVQDLSNAEDIFVVGHSFQNFTAALWFQMVCVRLGGAAVPSGVIRGI